MQFGELINRSNFLKEKFNHFPIQTTVNFVKSKFILIVPFRIKNETLLLPPHHNPNSYFPYPCR